MYIPYQEGKFKVPIFCHNENFIEPFWKFPCAMNFITKQSIQLVQMDK